MREKFVMLSLIGIPLLVLGQISPVAFSDRKDVFPAFDLSGSITLAAARVQLDIAYPRGKKERRDLTVGYSAQTGHYFWHCAEAPNDTWSYLTFLKNRGDAVFVDRDGLVVFGFGDALWAKVWRGRAGSLDAAVSAATQEIRQDLATLEGRGFHRDYKHITVFGPIDGFKKYPAAFKSIPPEFKCDMPNAFCPSDNNTIVSVSKQGNNWRLVLRNRYDVEVILDQNFRPVSTQQLTQPPPSDKFRFPK